MSEEKGLQTTSQILPYQAEDGQTKIEVQLQDETVWLTQRHMAELFQTSKQNIGQHLKNIFEEGELEESSVVKKFFTTAADGKRYQTSFYSLDALISVGYRIKSHVATRFRQWATSHIKELARILGVSDSVVSRWENGKASIGEGNDRLLRSIFMASVNEISGIHDSSMNILDLFKELPHKRKEIKMPHSINLNPQEWMQPESVCAV